MRRLSVTYLLFIFIFGDKFFPIAFYCCFSDANSRERSAVKRKGDRILRNCITLDLLQIIIFIGLFIFRQFIRTLNYDRNQKCAENVLPEQMRKN